MLFDRLARRWRWCKLRIAGGDVAYDLQSHGNFFFGNAQGFICGQGVYVAAGARFLIGGDAGKIGQLKIGDRVFINHNVIIDCHQSIEIGERVMIGPQTYICDFDHDIRQVNGSVIPEGIICNPVRIEAHAWIGANVTILKGVTIGRGAVIGAGSVITRDVPALAVAAGNPAKILKVRPCSDK